MHFSKTSTRLPALTFVVAVVLTPVQALAGLPDGHLDILFPGSATLNAAVCLNDGTGAFNCSHDARFGDAEEGAIGDLDGDGNTDIVWSVRTGNGSNVCLGDGTGSVTVHAVGRRGGARVLRSPPARRLPSAISRAGP